MARAAAAHVFVADLDDPRLAPEDAHHLTRVLRLRPGETVSAADGTGGWRRTVFVGGGVEPDGEVVRPVAAVPSLTVAMAVPKGDRAEWAVQKLTELGVDRIVALAAEHGVVRWDVGRAGRHLDRWVAVARAAAMQSRRLRLPVVEGPVSVAELLATGGPAACLAEPGGGPPDLRRPAVLIGPEGGWSPPEAACGLPTVELAPTVLRTETAAVVAGALLVALRSGLLRPSAS